ncbi:hypothetical protein I4U23_011446 [Adineta vaga]|nr:hypothetical protein I4U23_011446 [Adineta vaga]
MLYDQKSIADCLRNYSERFNENNPSAVELNQVVERFAECLHRLGSLAFSSTYPKVVQIYIVP